MARAVAGIAVIAGGIGLACSKEATGPNAQGITDVIMTPDTLTLAIGDTATLSAQAVNSSGGHVNGVSYFWSTGDPTIATVDKNGKVTAIAVGAVNIDASTAGVSPSHPARVTVVSTPVASVIVAPPAVTMRVGDAFQFTDTTKDAAGNVLTGRLVVWSSSDSTTASVDQAGLVLAKKIGSVTITAASGKASGTGSVTVTLVPVKKILISPTNPTVIIRDSTQLTAVTEDSIGNILQGRVVTWSSSDSTIASIDQTGTATGKKVGAVTITATSGGAQATVPLTVQAVPINAVVISPQSANLFVGKQQALTAEVTDASGNPIAGSTVTFSTSAPGIATVTATGPLSATVTAVGSGQATITGTSGTKTGTATINVSLIPVDTVIVTPTPDTVTLGGTVQLTATLKDSTGAVLTGRTVTWTSLNTGVATISQAGLVTSVGVGTAAISASSGGQKGLAEVTVNQVPVGSVNITPQNDTVGVGAQRQLSVQVLDANGHTITNPAVTWSSTNNGIVIVSSTGLVQGVQPGTAQIIAQSGGKSDTNTTLVVPATVGSVGVSIVTSTIAVGQTTVVTATSKDPNGNVLPGRSVTWSTSASNTATVSAGGVDPTTQLDTATVTGAAIGGPVTITATSTTNSSVQGTTQVSVTTAITSIVLTPNQFGLFTHGTQTVTAQASGSNGPIGGVTFTWSTKSGGAIASVNQSGVVTGVGPGTDTVFAAAQGKVGKSAVAVTLAPVASITVYPGSAQLANNATVQLTDTARDGNTPPDTLLNRPVTWSSSNNAIATVSNTGLVSPGSASPDTGLVTITATSTTNGVNGSASVHVTFPTATNVSVTPSGDTLYATAPGNTPLQMTATTTPTGVPIASWASNSGIVTVSTTGLVTPTNTAAGTATITATAATGGVSGNATVVIIGHVGTVTANAGATTLSVSSSLGLQDTTSVTATIMDTFGNNVSNRPVTWSSSDPTTITVANPGPVAGSTPVLLTAISNNSLLPVTITATSVDGSVIGQVNITVVP